MEYTFNLNSRFVQSGQAVENNKTFNRDITIRLLTGVYIYDT